MDQRFRSAIVDNLCSTRWQQRLTSLTAQQMCPNPRKSVPINYCHPTERTNAHIIMLSLFVVCRRPLKTHTHTKNNHQPWDKCLSLCRRFVSITDKYIPCRCQIKGARVSSRMSYCVQAWSSLSSSSRRLHMDVPCLLWPSRRCGQLGKLMTVSGSNDKYCVLSRHTNTSSERLAERALF